MASGDTTAIYLRVSRDDNSSDDSESIVSQRKMLMDYIQNHSDLRDIQVIEISDDGYSGSNFDRPGVQQLLDLARKRKVQNVIVKDFSRFGRSYIQVGDFIEQIFPFLGIRFISVSDNFDSIRPECGAGSIDAAFKHIMHAYYVKDLSIKIKTAKRTLMEQGAFISPYAIFGYKKAADKHKLEIDEPAAEIVRSIFTLIIQGYTTAETARILNSDDVITPNIHKQTNGYARNWNSIADKNHWTHAMIYRIVKDIRYTGSITGGKTYRIEPGNAKVKNKPRDEWYIRENMHEPIISASDFETAEKCLRRNKCNDCRTPRSQRNLFSRKLICAICGHALIRVGTGSDMYSCRYNLYSPRGRCFPTPINIKDLERSILASLKAQLAVLINQEELRIRNRQNSNISISTLNTQIKNANRHLDKHKANRRAIYEKYADGIISKEDYLSQRNECESQIAFLSDKLTELESAKHSLVQPNEDQALKLLLNTCNENFLDRQIIDTFIEKILVYDAKRIEIIWKYKNELRS